MLRFLYGPTGLGTLVMLLACGGLFSRPLPVGPPKARPEVSAEPLGPAVVTWQLERGQTARIEVFRKFGKNLRKPVYEGDGVVDRSGLATFEIDLPPDSYRAVVYTEMRDKYWEQLEEEKWIKEYDRRVEFRIDRLMVDFFPVKPAKVTVAPDCGFGDEHVPSRVRAAPVETLLDASGRATFDVTIPATVKRMTWASGVDVVSRKNGVHRVSVPVWDGIKSTSIETFFDKGAKLKMPFGTVSLRAGDEALTLECTLLPRHLTERERYRFPDEQPRDKQLGAGVTAGAAGIAVVAGGDQPLGSLDYIGTTRRSTIKLSRCDYASRSGRGHVISRKRHDEVVSWLDRRTGKVVASKRFQAPTPRCPDSSYGARTSVTTNVDPAIVAPWFRRQLKALR